MAGDTSACVEWPGCTRNADGYGILPAPVNGSRLAHRAALARKLGRPVVGLALHSCDNPPCVNPDHLREGTQADNMADARERGRVATGPRVRYCVRGHDTTTVGRGHAGQCNECRRQDAKRIADRRREERRARGLRRPTPTRFTLEGTK